MRNFHTVEEELLTPEMPKASGQRIKLIRSGDLLELEIAPYWDVKPKGVRSQRINPTNPKQSNQNAKDARKLFVRLVHCNFGSRDYHMVCSYEAAPSEDRARKDVNNLILRIQSARKRAGLLPAKWMYVIEFSEDEQKRIHCHLLIAGGLDRDVMEKLWTKGRTNCRRLQPDENILSGIANYLMKDPRGKKRWGASQGLKRPKITYKKITRRRAETIARDANAAREIFEKEHQSYTFMDITPPRWSEYVNGVYVCSWMRKVT